uniref:Gfo/Idh/MocA family protein n=1 Tax=Candidatus Enterococcus willemsii TaxID=1857215 RepID=UPI00403F77E5
MKIGFVGSGNMARTMAQTFQHVANAELVAIASTNTKTMNELSKDFEIPNCYKDYEEMLRNKTIEAVYIATPHIFHFEQAMLALKYNKHVLCEKPITINQWLTEQLFEYAAEKKLFVGEAFWTRFNPLALKMQQDIRNERFGRVISIMSDFGGYGLNSPRLTKKN